MNIILILFATIEWQKFLMPVSDSISEFTIFLRIPANELKYVMHDFEYEAEYEIQLKIFDKKGNQIAGDYWIRNIKKDSLVVVDSVKILLPNNARSFNLSILDLKAQEIFTVREKLQPIKVIANVRYTVISDTLYLKFIVLNEKGVINRIIVSLAEEKKEIPAYKGNYSDSLLFDVKTLHSGTYQIKVLARLNGKKIDEIQIPINISRPFYLEENVWKLKVEQLEYIATHNEISKLKSAPPENRDSLWKEFWEQYDPTPNTEFNEKEKEYFERIEYAEKNFSFGDKGWRSDRGRIYVKYGQPDEIHTRPYELGTRPYEVWFYYRLNLKFIFYDRHGFGEYILLTPYGERI